MYSIRRFSALTDQSYYDDLRNKKYKRSSNIGSSVIGAATGAALSSIGDAAYQVSKTNDIKFNKGSLGKTIAGAVIGSGIGYGLSKLHNKKMKKKEDKAIEKYNKLSDEDKRFMYERLNKEIDRDENRRNMMNAAAYNAALSSMYR